MLLKRKELDTLGFPKGGFIRSFFRPPERSEHGQRPQSRTGYRAAILSLAPVLEARFDAETAYTTAKADSPYTDRPYTEFTRGIFPAMARRVAVSILLFSATIAVTQSSSPGGRTFENQYVKMTILPGWTVTNSPPEVKVTHGKYVLTINPIYEHAGGVEGGRFGEASAAMPSVTAVRADVEGPWGTTCAQDQPGQEIIVNAKMSLGNLYTDDTKANVEDGCKFPSDGKSAWFGALFVGEGSESEYTITLAYDTTDVNELPRKGDPELTQVLNDTKTMLKTLELKPPIVVSSIEPKSAQPGQTIKVFGSGFNLPGNGVELIFVRPLKLGTPKPTISPDGKSLTFVVPTSIAVSTCPPGYLMKDDKCVVEPANYNESNDCPRQSDGSGNFCGVPFPPDTYELQISGSMVQSNRVTLSVLPPKPTPISISMLYPNRGISPGGSITVRGSGFTPTGNTVKIGNSVVSNVPSPDGKTLAFQAPALSGAELVSSGAYLSAFVQASVENAKGKSNVIAFDYWYPGPNALHCQKGGIRINVPPQSVPKH